MAKMMAVVAALSAAACMFPALAQVSGNCLGFQGCGHDRVAIIRCETDPEGSIKVLNSSVTSASGVTVRRGDKCAATVSALLQAGLRLSYGPMVTARSVDREVSLSFVFVAGYSDDSDDDRDDDDRDDD